MFWTHKVEVPFHKFGYCCCSLMNMYFQYIPHIWANMHINPKLRGKWLIEDFTCSEKQAISWSVPITFIICLHRIERSPKCDSLLAAVYISFLFRLQTFLKLNSSRLNGRGGWIFFCTLENKNDKLALLLFLPHRAPHVISRVLGKFKWQFHAMRMVSQSGYEKSTTCLRKLSIYRKVFLLRQIPWKCLN